jgi:hypothetical protein
MPTPFLFVFLLFVNYSSVEEQIVATVMRKIPQMYGRNPRVLLCQFIRQSTASLPTKYISE